MRSTSVCVLLVVGCGGAGAARTDGGAAADAGAPDQAALSVPEVYRFSAEMDAHLVAAQAEAGTTVCCDSEIGCFTSTDQGLCANTDGSVPAGTSFRFWFLNSTGGLSISVETSEPPTGFTGACLLGPDGRLSDQVQLPVVCFSPEGNVQYGAGTSTEVIVRADEVLQSDTPPAASFDDYPYAGYEAYDYQVLMTCYPKSAAGACPSGSDAISHSCCNVGAPMTYLYENLAHGFVDLTSS
jgi:hypothetical protein